MDPRPEDRADLSPNDPTLVSWGAWCAVVALGGALGGCLRHAAHLAIEPVHAGSIPSVVLATLAVNLIGAGLLGGLMGHLTIHGGSPLLHPFLAVGVLSSFTTYSSLVFQSHLLFSTQGPAAAALHFVATGVLGMLAFAAGEAAVGEAR